jgi:acetyl esterase/lipase
MGTPHTLEGIKEGIRERIGRRDPFTHADSVEAEEALGRLKGIEPEHWAEVWTVPARRWEEKGRLEEKAGKTPAAREAYTKAYGYYGIARHPFPNSPAKVAAYGKAREMYLAAARFFDPPLEKILVPFGDKQIVGYLRLPAKKPAPVVMHWGGIDGWKEERHSTVETLLKRGWGCWAMDAPGTGEAPIKASADAHRIFSTAIDYLCGRADVDSKRIAVLGSSFGGYWATKLAFVERERLRAVVNWGGGIHRFFQPEWQEKSRNALSYLFDLIESRANLFGKKTFAELIEVMPALSLKTQGWLDKPCAPLLLVNGKDDKQVPIDDFHLLLESGEPKSARFFPGGHMGNSREIFPVVLGWLERMFGDGR